MKHCNRILRTGRRPGQVNGPVNLTPDLSKSHTHACTHKHRKPQSFCIKPACHPSTWCHHPLLPPPQVPAHSGLGGLRALQPARHRGGPGEPVVGHQPERRLHSQLRLPGGGAGAHLRPTEHARTKAAATPPLNRFLCRPARRTNLKPHSLALRSAAFASLPRAVRSAVHGCGCRAQSLTGEPQEARVHGGRRLPARSGA